MVDASQVTSVRSRTSRRTTIGIEQGSQALNAGVRSVLADIETQPDGDISWGGNPDVSTSTQLHSPGKVERLGENFGDVSAVVKPCTAVEEKFKVPMSPAGVAGSGMKRSRLGDTPEATGGKNFIKKLCLMDDSDEESETEPSTRVFMMYHVDDQTDRLCREVITDLRGSLVTDTSETSSCPGKVTHLIMDSSNTAAFKRATVLQCLASGTYILTSQYLYDSKKHGRFLDEEKYVIGVGSLFANIQQDKMKFWKKWREFRMNRGTGAFDGWKCALLTSDGRQSGQRRLLESGGAILVNREASLGDQVTHVFLNKGDVDTFVRMKSVCSQAIIVSSEYILHYLSKPEIDPKLFHPSSSGRKE